jgi:WD40 repeat protein
VPCHSSRSNLGDELFKLTASDAAESDYFGWSVALSDNMALVGAIGGDVTGAAYLFDVTTGQELRKLTASNAAELDEFGASVAISGNKAIVGAIDVKYGSWPTVTSAHVFDVTTGAELYKFTGSNPEVEDRFGTSVAISGNIAVVGAPWDSITVDRQGSAYLFDVTTGQQLFKLAPSDAGYLGMFGTSVVISGNTALIGAPGGEARSGSAYLFDVNTGQELAKLTVSDPTFLFGLSVAISGNIAVVGSLGLEGVEQSSAYLFDVATGQELLKLTSVPGPHVAISGNQVLIGGGYSASLFDVTTGRELLRELTAPNAIGFSIAMNNNVILVGAAHEDYGTGAAYLFSTVPGPASLALLVVGLPLLVWRNPRRWVCAPRAMTF